MKPNSVREAWDFVCQHPYAHVRPMAQAACVYPSLRRLFPYVSLSALRFSRTDEDPYDQDLPFMRTTSGGDYEACIAGEERFVGGLSKVVERVAEFIEKMIP